jgi:hypothetical protein
VTNTPSLKQWVLLAKIRAEQVAALEAENARLREAGNAALSLYLGTEESDWEGLTDEVNRIRAALETQKAPSQRNNDEQAGPEDAIHCY